jgi:hypothetical protein
MGKSLMISHRRCNLSHFYSKAAALLAKNIKHILRIKNKQQYVETALHL